MGSLKEIRRYSRLHEALTGGTPYLFTSRPGDGQVRVVFTDGPKLGYRAGAEHMREAYERARAAWRAENHPDAEVTDAVAMWIANDGDFYTGAQRVLQFDGLDGLARHLTAVLRSAREQSAAWHTLRGLSARDLESVDWPEVAEAITEEE
jgi:hypothetical protein